MGEPIGRSEYRRIEGSYEESTKELSVGDQKISNVVKGFWGWVGWFFGQNVHLKIQHGEKTLSLYVPKKTAQEMTQTTEKIGRKLAEILYKKAIIQPRETKSAEVPLQKQESKVEETKQSEIQKATVQPKDIKSVEVPAQKQAPKVEETKQSEVQKAIVQPKEIKTVKVPEQVPKIEEAKRSEIQAELKQNGIPLTCREFAPLAQPNHMQEEEIQKYLQSLPEEYRAIKEKLFNNVQKISYQELQAALFACVQELNQILNGNEFAIGFAENKSQKWIAELALQFMAKTPKESFTTYTAPNVISSPAGTKQSPLTGKTDNFVVFDDASYSGTQLAELLDALVGEMRKQPEHPRNICLVVPFMSEPAKKRVLSYWSRISPPGTELHVITSTIHLKSFAEKYPPDSAEREELFQCERELKKIGLEKYKPEYPSCYLGGGGADNKSLAYMEWKVPDTFSVPHNIVETEFEKEPQLHFMTDFPPPYKAKK